MRDGMALRRRNVALTLGLALALLIVLAGCGGGPVARGAGTTGSSAGDLTRDVAYGPLPAERLDLCEPRAAPGKRPGVVLIHGGGWEAGDKRDYATECAALAGLGFVAVSVNYRLSQDAPWPAQIVDAQLALRWLRAQSARLDLDPARICAWGFSAGGHLAALLGSLDAIHPGDEVALYADQSPKAACVVDEAGPADLATALEAEPLRDMVLKLFGGATDTQAPDTYRDASPVARVTPQSAPTIIAQGTRDTTVQPDQSRALQAALQAHGVPVRYVSFDGGHGYAGLSQARRDAITAQLAAFVRERVGGEPASSLRAPALSPDGAT